MQDDLLKKWYDNEEIQLRIKLEKMSKIEKKISKHKDNLNNFDCALFNISLENGNNMRRMLSEKITVNWENSLKKENTLKIQLFIIKYIRWLRYISRMTKNKMVRSQSQ